MKWKGRRQSSNVEDRRGESVPTGRGHSRAGSGLLNILLLGFLRASPKGKLVMIVIAAIGFLFFRGPMMQLLNSTGGESISAPRIEQSAPGENDEMRAYLSTMMADNEEVWNRLLAQTRLQFRPARMVIYSRGTRIPGGVADSRMGPFYMPSNDTIYIDPTFFDELKQKFGATGDFAEAYVVAHEYGHHIQNISGRLNELNSKRGRVPKAEFNRASVRVELHADFLAGVFARSAQATFGEFLERGDIEEAMRAAEAVGDDRIQKQTSGSVNPDLFTHGTSAQRARWFNRGFESGDLRLGEQLYSLPYEQL
ncbi:MAG: neutral zinc metallopeptidase [Verrucomicrobiota bacterium]